MPPRVEELTCTQEHAAPSASQMQVVAMWPGGMVSKLLPEEGRLTVGRSAQCDIVIDHPSVSREHAAFYGGMPVEVEDLGSTNGTSVGGARVPPRTRVPVEQGRAVAIGAAVLVLHSAAERTAAPAGRSVGASPRSRDPGIVVVDEAMHELYRIVDLVAPGDLSVILLGETGTGKEVIADTIHRRSSRAASEYVRLNCGAVPDALLESELFGHERGAFTGAQQAKPGLLEVADGGTVFLDEVAELPLGMQVKLLRVLENREITRVGGLRPRRIDVRIVCATNGDLTSRISAGAFRQDLYFRLNGITLTIPPLRARKSEIAPLAQGFVREASRRLGKPPPVLSAAALARLETYLWPGNVRELKNTVERAVTLCTDGVIEVRHFALSADPPPGVGDRAAGARRASASSAPPPSGLGLQEDARQAARAIERRSISEAMDRCGGNQTRAAKMLRISRRTLVARLTEYGFARPLKDRGSEPEG